MTTTPSTTRAVLSLLLAGLLLCACLLPACAVDLRDLPDWVRAQLFPVELDYQGMYPIPGLAPTLTPVAPAAATAAGTPATVSIPGAGDVGALRTIGGSPAGVRPDGLSTVSGPGAAAAMGSLSTVGGPTVTGGGLGGLNTVGGPAVTGGGLGNLGTVSVPGGRPSDLTALGGVSVSGAAPRTGDLQAFATKGIGRGAQCIDVIRAERMTPKQFVAWADENGITTDEIVAAMQYSGIDWPELAPESMPLAAALHARISDELTGIADLPMIARLLLATYFGKQHRDDDARKVYAAITDDELRAHPRRDVHTPTSYLVFDCPSVALDILDRYAVVLGERRLLCTEYRIACTTLTDESLIRGRLVPAARAALAEMPPTDYWGNALRTLIWGHQQLGDHAAAIDDAVYWLRRLDELGVSPGGIDGYYVRMSLADSLAQTGRYAESAEMLRIAYSLAEPGGADAAAAQIALLKLAEIAAPVLELDATQLMAARHYRTSVTHLSCRIPVGACQQAEVEVVGSPTFAVEEASSTSGNVHVSIGSKEYGSKAGVTTIKLDTGPYSEPGEAAHTVTLRTNDPDCPTIEVLVEVVVLPRVRVSPSSLFFGYVPPRGTCSAAVVLVADAPFTVAYPLGGDTPPDPRVRLLPDGEGRWRVEADFEAGEAIGVVKGHLCLTTDIPQCPTVTVPYYAHVVGDGVGENVAHD